MNQLQAQGLSQRRACSLVDISSSVLRYEPKQDGNAGLRERLKELACQHRRHGYRMLHNRLRQEGFMHNIKRTYRLYRQEDLTVRRRRRKKQPIIDRLPLIRPERANEMWSMDFVFDELANGRRIKTLTVVDDCTKESLQIAVDTSMPARYVTRVLDQIRLQRGNPKAIRTDNGPEFAGRVMQEWAATHGITHQFTQPGKPTQNAYIESFNGKFRDECLSQHWFASVSHARCVIDEWREDYNHHRPHSALGYEPPAKFAARCLQHAADISQPSQSDMIASTDSKS